MYNNHLVTRSTCFRFGPTALLLTSLQTRSLARNQPRPGRPARPASIHGSGLIPTWNGRRSSSRRYRTRRSDQCSTRRWARSSASSPRLLFALFRSAPSVARPPLPEGCSRITSPQGALDHCAGGSPCRAFLSRRFSRARLHCRPFGARSAAAYCNGFVHIQKLSLPITTTCGTVRTRLWAKSKANAPAVRQADSRRAAAQCSVVGAARYSQHFKAH